MKEKALVIVAFVLTFAAGVLTGALVVRQFSPPGPPQWARQEKKFDRPHLLPMEVLKSKLLLSDEQGQKIAAIIGKHEKQLHEHFSQIRPDSRQIVQNMTAKIDSVLTPEQRQQFRAQFPLLGKMPHGHRKAFGDSSKGRF